MRTLRDAIRRLRTYAAARAVILMYHRVADVDADPWGLSVGRAHFAEHMAVLRRRGRPLALGELARALREGTVPRRAVVVTFDDGYADNLHHAKPLLERHDVPATVFVTSGYVGAEREFWWDELAALLLQPGTLPPTLRLGVDGRVLEVELGDAAGYGEEEQRRDRARRAWDAPPSSRLGLYHRVWEDLRQAPDGARQAALGELAGWAGRPRGPRAGHRPLDRRELAALAHGGLVAIGAHSVSHPFLSALAPAEQRTEIARSRADLEDAVGQPITTFAYPHGDHAPATRALVRENGFVAACTTRPASVTRADDPYALPRCDVQDWNGDEFDAHVGVWLRG